MKTLGYLKGKLLEWNKSTFGRLHKNKIKLWAELQDIDNKIEEVGRRTEDLVVGRRETLMEMERILKVTEIFWHLA